MFHEGGDALSDWQWEILTDLVHERVLSVFQLRYLDAKIDTLGNEGYAELVEWFQEKPRNEGYQVRPGVYLKPGGGFYLVTEVDGVKRTYKLSGETGDNDRVWLRVPWTRHALNTTDRLAPTAETMMKASYLYPFILPGNRS